MDGPIVQLLARGGSTGLPGKHLLPLYGTPIIGLLAQRFSTILPTYINTDCLEIARVAQIHGARFEGLRPADLADVRAAVEPAVEWLREKIGHTGPTVVCLGNYPFVSRDTVDRIAHLLKTHSEVRCYHRLPCVPLARYKRGKAISIELPDDRWSASWPRGYHGNPSGGTVHLVIKHPEWLDIDTHSDYRRAERVVEGTPEPPKSWNPYAERYRLHEWLIPYRHYPEWMHTLSAEVAPGLFRQAKPLFPNAPYRRQDLEAVYEVIDPYQETS